MTSSDIRFIALDLDNTLLRSDGSVSPRNVDAVEKARSGGIQPIVATARPPRKTAELLGGFLSDDPAITYSGARVRIDGQLIHEQTIELPSAQLIVERLVKRAPGARISVEIDDRLYSTLPHPAARPEDIVDVRKVLDREPVKIMLGMTHDGIPDDILEDLPSDVRCVLSDGGGLAQIMHADVSKSGGVRRVVEELGGELENVIAFGDDINDLEMIRDCGIGVAMDNAVDPVKAVADRVTLSNDEDGVAVVLEELLLG